MSSIRIVTIPGSLRAASFNRKLITLANESLSRVQVEYDALDLKEFPMPPYDGDIEDATGLPDSALKLKAKIAAAHGIIIASPEYNFSISGMLKNVIDWTSRGDSKPWTGKIVGLMGATSGPWGTQRMMPQLRLVMSAVGAIVVPEQINVANAAKVWDESGRLLDEKLRERVGKFVEAVVSVTKRMNTEK